MADIRLSKKIIDCAHTHIQVIREGRKYQWSCADCGKPMLTWSDKVWNTLFEEMPKLADGEGFKFHVVSEEDAEPRAIH